MLILTSVRNLASSTTTLSSPCLGWRHLRGVHALARCWARAPAEAPVRGGRARDALVTVLWIFSRRVHRVARAALAAQHPAGRRCLPVYGSLRMWSSRPGPLAFFNGLTGQAESTLPLEVRSGAGAHPPHRARGRPGPDHRGIVLARLAAPLDREYGRLPESPARSLPPVRLWATAALLAVEHGLMWDVGPGGRRDLQLVDATYQVPGRSHAHARRHECLFVRVCVAGREVAVLVSSGCGGWAANRRSAWRVTRGTQPPLTTRYSLLATR